MSVQVECRAYLERVEKLEEERGLHGYVNLTDVKLCSVLSCEVTHRRHSVRCRQCVVHKEVQSSHCMNTGKIMIF